LGELGNIDAISIVSPLLDRKRPSTRLAVAKALVGLATPTTLSTFREALRHDDPQVKYRAGLGLAYAGDPQAAPLVFSPEAANVLSVHERLIAAFTLGPSSQDQLVSLLDENDEKIRDRALLILLLLELAENSGSPNRCLACLASRIPRVRLTAAQALERFHSREEFSKFVVDLFNDRGEAQPWKISEEIVHTIANLLAFGQPQTKARTAKVLEKLSQSEVSAWNQAWKAHSERFAQEIAKVNQIATTRPPSSREYDLAQLRQLAFGAYVGLVREKGDSTSGDTSIVRVRQTALSRILALAQADPSYSIASKPIFIQAMGDPNQPVRMQAFEHLQTVGLDRTTLGLEALESGHTDLAIKGLELLTDGTSSSEGEKVLEQVMQSRMDHLAIEAAKLLIARRSKIAVAQLALTASFEELRLSAVAWLSEEYEQDSKAQQGLRTALESRYQKVRESAAISLGNKKDPVAYDALVKLLQTTLDASDQSRALNALITLGDKRTPFALLERLENDPAKTALDDEILPAIGDFRQPETVDRLFAYAEKSGKWSGVQQVIQTISGYDQPIEDPEDQSPDRKWEKEQHPRRDNILTRLLEISLQRSDIRYLKEILPDARWARGKEVDPVLALLINNSDAELRISAVEAIGWRLRKRGGSAEPLIKSLRHRDPNTQFVAAEGLAWGKRAEGINILLSSIEYLDDFGMRERAVYALGELGDTRAVDTLLKLANEDGNALQEAAAEAIGHLGKSPQAEEIFKLLSRFAKNNDSLAVNALKGLRWLNTHAAWQLIRQRAADKKCWCRDEAVRLLGFNDEVATRDLLIKFLSNESQHDEVLEPALESARRLWGPDSLEPDYAVLRSGANSSWGEIAECLNRVCERGEPDRIFDILPSCDDNAQNELASTLQNRSTLAEEKVWSALTHPHTRTVQLAAHILGQTGKSSKEFLPTLQSAITKWLAAWSDRLKIVHRQNITNDEELQKITRCLETLLWAAGRLTIAPEILMTVAQAHPDEPKYRSIRNAALSALISESMNESTIALLEKFAFGNDPEARTLAIESLGKHSPKRGAELAEKILSDRVSFDRLAKQDTVPLESTLRSAGAQLHYQGVVLPHLIRRKDFDALVTIAKNNKLPEATRLGAIEGLAALADEKAETILIELGKTEKELEEIRKAAWRGLRRSRRLRKKQLAKK
jgi:ParB family transcriptional regulator, chromosome partitioning protein